MGTDCWPGEELMSNLYIVQTAGTLQELSWELNTGHPTPVNVFRTSDVSISEWNLEKDYEYKIMLVTQER